jgi:hypothetical protein
MPQTSSHASAFISLMERGHGGSRHGIALTTMSDAAIDVKKARYSEGTKRASRACSGVVLEV